MKKKLLLIAFSLLFVVSGITLYFTRSDVTSYADSVVVSEETHNVNFVAPDNSILYSTGDYVPSGSSLYYLENSNVITNSFFSEVPVVGNRLNTWYFSGNPSYTINSSIPYLTLNPNTSTSTKYLLYDLDTSLYRGKTLTFSVNINGNIYSTTWTVKSSGTGGSYTYSTGLGIGLRFYIYNNNRMGVTFDIFTSLDDSVNIYWVKVEESSTFTGYYNSEYINHLLESYNFSNYYYSYDLNKTQPITSDKYYYPKLNYVSNSTWYSKIWSGLTSFDGNYVWTDGTNYYYSSGNSQYVLDITTSTWTSKTWSGLTSFDGFNVWTDGTNYYYSVGNSQYVLDITTSTWTQKTWSGLTSFNGSKVWTDGTNYYYSVGNSQYVLDTTTSTWTSKTWSGLTSFDGANIWTDGTNYYYSSYITAGGVYNTQYVLDTNTSTWTQKTWNGFNNLNGANVWTDGTNYYYSSGNSQYILDINTSTWTQKTWSGLTSFNGSNVWLTNFGIFYSYSFNQFVLGDSLFDINPDYYYDQGYADGYSSGYSVGFNSGYNTGLDDAGNYTFFSLFGAVLDAPVKTLTGLFNFDLLGVNLWRFFTALFTLAIIILIIKLCLGGK